MCKHLPMSTQPGHPSRGRCNKHHQKLRSEQMVKADKGLSYRPVTLSRPTLSFTYFNWNWNCCNWRTPFVMIWKRFCFILSTGSRTRIDSVMCPRSMSTSSRQWLQLVRTWQVAFGWMIALHGVSWNDVKLQTYNGWLNCYAAAACVWSCRPPHLLLCTVAHGY